MCASHACVRRATHAVLQRGLLCSPAVVVAMRALCRTATATTTTMRHASRVQHVAQLTSARTLSSRAAVVAAVGAAAATPMTVAVATSSASAAATLATATALSSSSMRRAMAMHTTTTATHTRALVQSRWLAAYTAPCRCLCTHTRPVLLPSSSSSSSSSSSNTQTLKSALDKYRKDGDDEEQQQDDGGMGDSGGPGYLPFPPPFHTINVVMLLLLANVVVYLVMHFGSDEWRDWVIEHCTLSRENWHRLYPLVTNAFYQENLLQLLIDGWLLWQFGETMLNFLGNTRLTFFALLCTLGGSALHLARQHFDLYYGKDELEVRGHCYGPNPFIMGLIAVEGLIFRHLNFIQQPPVPFLVLTAFVMVIDVWRIFTTLPQEHGAATGGALMAYLFWALPTRMLGLDKLTAAL